ncbi:esterase family protein [Pseudosporangium ferrugineum]|uniref:Esterase/lipase superfamily enzyme n=1 Tax=Pseudosporangium ferrugineum TaxID=439699 RepID=A0A2T0RUG0_9ACTN|nr:alpha/beta hydrolase-fold protein [Pseudosporangium ferrugineum]PRY24787.1 esterase/lipase superfamily enzyme [Pseudosporangium ferrugineum]
MRHYSVDLAVPGGGRSGTVAVYGHWGRPVLVFPTEGGDAWEFSRNGMVGAAGELVESGRVKLYCVDSFDAESWSAHHLPLEERAWRHAAYESWVLDAVVPHIRQDSGDAAEIVTAGCSLGAFHALNFAFKRADLFPLALCFSGNYDPGTWRGWGDRGDAVYFNSPGDYVANLDGDHLAWLRERLSVLLVCGQGRWEDTTGALESTRRMGGLLAAKGVWHELDLWGADVPHDWESWRRQFAHHLPRFG